MARARRPDAGSPRSGSSTIVAEGFLSRLSFGLVSLGLPLYALHIGMDVSAIGLLVSLNVIVQLAAKPFMGRIADRMGHRRTLLLAISARSLVPLLLVFAAAPWQLFAIRVVYGLAQALRDPPLNAIIADSGGKDRVAAAFAWYHTAKNVAASLGRAAAGLLLSLTGGAYGILFLAAFGMSVTPLLAVLLLVPATVGSARLEREDQPSPAERVRVFPLTGLGFLFGITAGTLNLFPVIATKYFGLTPAQIGAILLASTIVILLAGPAFGWLADHVSRMAVLLVRGLANITSSLVFLAFGSLGGVAAGRLIDDAGKAAFRPAWGSIMAEVAAREPRRRAHVMAVIEVGEDAGDAAGPVLAGWLLALGGLPLMFGVRCALAAVTEVWAWKTTHHLGERPPDRQRRAATSQSRTGS